MKEKLSKVSESIQSYKDKINSEEATKHYLILPFLQALGYDVFNPDDLMPEVICDFTNKGDKVDYILYQNQVPSVLIECKVLGTNLSNHIGQLAKYFSTSSANFAILTDGRFYWFFTDLEKSNLMDNSPFLKVDLSNLSEYDFKYISLFSKENFDGNNIKSFASNLYYSFHIKKAIIDCFNYPNDQWIKMLCGKGLKDALNSKGINFFRQLIQENIKDVAINMELQNSDEVSEYSKGGFTSEEINILDIINSFFIDVKELNGHIFIDKISDGIIRINYDNQYWNICRLKLGVRTKYIFICKDAHVGEGQKYKIDSQQDVLLLKDKIIEAALVTRSRCIDWRESHNE